MSTPLQWRVVALVGGLHIMTYVVALCVAHSWGLLFIICPNTRGKAYAIPLEDSDGGIALFKASAVERILEDKFGERGS